MRLGRVTTLAAAALLAAGAAAAQTALSGDTIHITRATGPITVDGDLSDAAWRDATRVEKWYETKPGDNLEPKVRNVGYLAFDDKYLYAAFEFDDPNPSAIRAPYADRDNINGNSNDYGGLLLDARNTGSNSVLFVATPRNTQYDSIIDDSTNEDASPDFFWDSATKITERGWTLEIRIPFSSIRYKNVDPQTWRVMLYRNYPRDFHYQFFTARLPRDSNCFVCRANVLTGLERLPGGGHIVVAPYAAASNVAERSGPPGSPLGDAVLHSQIGVDVKYLPNADNAVDLTVKPDFSQVESDTAQIATNQRFALFYPEKRPFFLEGIDMFATPLQAVYTRTITAPIAGGRVTGKAASVRYTVLVADDDGGGSAILPGPNGSDFAPIDFGSTVFIGRAKRDIGLSFISVLATDREHHAVDAGPGLPHDGAGYNRVVGPDFQWRPSGQDVVSGQWLYSNTKTPNRPHLADEWTGQTLTGHASQVQWSHQTVHVDWFAQYRDISEGFRADTGFIPQVGYRELNGYTGWTFRPTNFLSRFRAHAGGGRQLDMSGNVISRNLQPGVSMDSKLSGFMQFQYVDSSARTPAGVLIERRQFQYYVQFSPSRYVAQIQSDASLGEDIDFENSRPGHGPTINASATLRPTDHLELALLANQQWLSVADAAGISRRLFTARVLRVKGTYTFTSRLFARAIAQYVSVDRDPSLYIHPVPAQSGNFGGSLLLAYKLNWQSVMFVGYGDDRELATIAKDEAQARRLAPLDRQVFVKVSYAFQR
jgi:Domain of unknown function (DUF5916)